jgi:hypothetical protein
VGSAAPTGQHRGETVQQAQPAAASTTALALL